MYKETLLKKCLPLIKKFEGLSLQIYHCPAGLATIGYGHVIQSHEQFTSITESEAENLLMQDLEAVVKSISRMVRVPLNANQLAALTSFTFNVGAAAFQRSTLRQKVNHAEHGLVPIEIRKWIWCQGRVLSGLKLRREAEAALYSS